MFRFDHPFEKMYDDRAKRWTRRLVVLGLAGAAAGAVVPAGAASPIRDYKPVTAPIRDYGPIRDY